MQLFGLIEIKIRLLTIKSQVKETYLKEGAVKAYSKYKELTKSDLSMCIKTVRPWLIKWGYEVKC